MLKAFARLVFIGLVGLLTSGCLPVSFGFKAVVMTQIVPAAPQPPGPPGAQLPAIQLEYNGQRTAGVPSEYRWLVTGPSTSDWQGGSAWAPNLSYPGTLSAPLGQAIAVVVSYPSPPAALRITDLDSLGLPTASSVLTGTSSLIPYTASRAGQDIWMVEAFWSHDQHVSYLFSVDIRP